MDVKCLHHIEKENGKKSFNSDVDEGSVPG